MVFGAVLLWCGGAGAASATQTVRVLVVKATWGPQPQPDVRNLTQPTAAFFANASFGTVQLAFTETPWLTAYSDQSVCANPPQLLDQGQAAAASYAPTTYDHVIYVTPCSYIDFGSDVFHRGTIGLPASAQLFEHELGHTFGISHAGSLDCERTCKLDPYGNPIDVMGDGIGDFGALQKAEQAGRSTSARSHPWDVQTWCPGNSEPLRASARHPSRRARHLDRPPRSNRKRRDLKTSVWKRVSRGVLVHETPANPTSIPFNQRKPDTLLGNGGPRGQWLMHGKTFTIPHVLTITILRHVGTTVTLRLRPLH